MYLPRTLTARLERLVDTFPVVVVSGARQVGKSTFLRHTLGGRFAMVVFDPVADVQGAREDPDLFLNSRPPPVILDEIQYVPQLVSAIKRRIDADRTPGQYVLTGSHQWGILRSLSESLAGRAVFLDLEGFSLAEAAGRGLDPPWLGAWLADPEGCRRGRWERLPAPFPVFEQVWRGSLPEARFLPADVLPDFFRAYQRTYLERDVRLMADVSDWYTFGRFVRLVAALTGQEVNHSQLGRELGVTPQTAQRWLGILRATFQWHEVPAFTGNLIKRVSRRPKGYMADPGLACALQAIAAPEVLGGHPLWGALFETAVVGDLRRQCAALPARPNLYHWRSHGGAEVDLIVEWGGRFYPIEIKAKSHPTARDASGLRAFRAAHPGLPVAPGLIIAPADTAYPVTEQDLVVPWDVACPRPAT
ncbi:MULTISPECIES: ATP-binding protein [Deferrisoma]